MRVQVFFPFMAQPEETQLFSDPDKKATLFYTLDGGKHKRMGFVVELKRPQGCQYLNTHSDPISVILNCNTNVQTGDWAHCFYQIFYETKVAIKEDSLPMDLVARSIVWRLLNAQDAYRQREAEGEERDANSDWLDGLSTLLSGINAASSRTVTSAPMAASLVMTGRDRFIFSHNFSELLLGQMEAVLHGEDVSFICRRCKDKDNKNIQWPDVSANDYLHRPETIHNMCFAEQITKYSKAYKQVKLQDKKNNTLRKNSKTNTELLVGKDHPGNGFAY